MPRGSVAWLEAGGSIRSSTSYWWERTQISAPTEGGAGRELRMAAVDPIRRGRR